MPFEVTQDKMRNEYPQFQSMPTNTSCAFEYPGMEGRKQTVTKMAVPTDEDEAARIDVYYFDRGNSG